MVRFQRRDPVAEVGEFAPEVILQENLLRGGMREVARLRTQAGESPLRQRLRKTGKLP